MSPDADDLVPVTYPEPAVNAPARQDDEHDDDNAAFNLKMAKFCKAQTWGHFKTFVWKKISGNRGHGAIELTCPYHKKNQTTSCKKACSLRGR